MADTSARDFDARQPPTVAPISVKRPERDGYLELHTGAPVTPMTPRRAIRLIEQIAAALYSAEFNREDRERCESQRK